MGPLFFRFALFAILFSLSAPAQAGMPTALGDTQWQLEIANDSPNGWTFSDAYETHATSLRKVGESGWLELSAALVAPKRPKRAADDWTANRAFGELLTAGFSNLHRKTGRGAWYIGGALTLIGSLGLDSVQEEVHNLLGYVSMRNDLQNARMNDAVMVSALLDYRRRLNNDWLADGGFELGTRRNAASFKISKTADCARFAWNYHAKLELVANDEVVSAAPLNADIRHLVPTLGVGMCFTWRGFPIEISEEISLPRIRSDDDIFPMVRLRVGF